MILEQCRGDFPWATQVIKVKHALTGCRESGLTLDPLEVSCFTRSEEYRAAIFSTKEGGVNLFKGLLPNSLVLPTKQFG